MRPGKIILESRRGSTGDQNNPWFAIERGDLRDEDHGDVWFGALGWSGSWSIAIEEDPTHQVRVTAASIHSILLTRFHPARNCTRLLPMGDSLAMASGEHLGYSTALRLERYCPTLRIRISVPFCTTHGRQRDSM